MILAAALLGGCRSGDSGDAPTPVPSEVESAATPTVPQTVVPEPTLTPTATPVPLALMVNGEGVSLDDYTRAVQRFQAGIPTATAEEAARRVQADLIDQLLLSQAAVEAGFAFGEGEFETRLAALIADAGGEEAFNAWMAANFYTRELFERDLRRSIAAAWMRDRIYAEVPASAEQVRARQIRLTTQEEAESVLTELSQGTTFDLLVSIYDPEGLGELGWFPRGVLFEPAIEEAAFSLSEGDYAGVIETPAGFHIIQVTDRANDRPLDPDALWTLQLKALDDWLSGRRAAGEIVLLLEP